MPNAIQRRLAAVAIAGVFALPARAATVTECLDDVATARATIAAASTFVNPARDQAGLLGKADSAAAKLDKGKFADAAEVLVQMAAKVIALAWAEKPKLGTEEAAVISAAIAEAQVCVAQLMAP